MILNIYFHEEANLYAYNIIESVFFQQIKMYIQPRASFSHFFTVQMPIFLLHSFLPRRVSF